MLWFAVETANKPIRFSDDVHGWNLIDQTGPSLTMKA
jgi:hypothetical protein